MQAVPLIFNNLMLDPSTFIPFMTPLNSNIHVAYVSHSYQPYETPESLLSAHFTSTEWVNALSKAGVKVSLFYRFNADHHFRNKGVDFYFIKDRLPPLLKSYHLGYAFHRKVASIVKSKKIDVIHAHNPHAIFPNWTLKRLTPAVPMLIQDHAAAPSIRFPWLNSQMLSHVNAVVFSARGQEKPWLKQRVLPSAKCYFVMENSSSCAYEQRNNARVKTNMFGQPIFLWVGNLNKNKDPLTALKAFKLLLRDCPHTMLYMIYRINDLEEEVKKFILENSGLADRVVLLGAMERSNLEKYYNSADFIISCSHKEGSGYSIIEAMSCGVIPILSNIPSFATLTHNGKIGALFDIGDVNMLLQKMKQMVIKNIDLESNKVLDHFNENFSSSVLAKKMISVYHHILPEHG
jgi:glycosyltransferase involved in cell wall biosynthesis